MYCLWCVTNYVGIAMKGVILTTIVSQEYYKMNSLVAYWRTIPKWLIKGLAMPDVQMTESNLMFSFNDVIKHQLSSFI